MNKIYITSDLHFCHDKDFIYKPRGFNSVQEMNETIIKNFNEIVDWSDKLYILGDFFLNDNSRGSHLLLQLLGEKHIIWGNHDDTESRRTLLTMLASSHLNLHGYATTLKYKGYNFYLSHYPTLTSNCDEDKPLKRRVINLCGHTHTKDKFKDMDKGLIYHCELDAHNNKPVLIDDIIEDIKKYIKE